MNRQDSDRAETLLRPTDAPQLKLEAVLILSDGFRGEVSRLPIPDAILPQKQGRLDWRTWQPVLLNCRLGRPYLFPLLRLHLPRDIRRRKEPAGGHGNPGPARMAGL